MPDRRPGSPGSASDVEPDSTDPDLRVPPVGAPDPVDVIHVIDPLAATAPHRVLAPLPEPAGPSEPSAQRPVRTSLHPGVLLDARYQLQNHISDRAEIQLWQGEDQVLARPVAIRLVVDDHTEAAAEGAHRLLQAARRSGQLLHTGAASTYDATTTSADGLPLAYVVSEWVSGISLLTLLKDGPLLPDRAASIVRSVAQVIAAAHESGVAHGDLHPGDVIITSHGLVKVLDLEMRSALGERSAAERRERDVVGLGALLYAALTGRWPLGPTRDLPAAELDPSGACRSPRQLRAGVPRELDALAMAALSVGDGPAGGEPQRDASGDPHPTAAEFAASLVAILAELPTGSNPALDDNPEADMPAFRTAKAAQAERVARDSAARRRSIRRRVTPIVLLVALALIAWVVGVAVGKLPGDSTKQPKVGSGATTAKPTGQVLKLASVTDFDPLGDGQEDPTGVPFAYDDNIGTYWSTEIYNLPKWGGSATKTGVGLRVDLGRSVNVSQVQLLFTQPGVSVELRFSDEGSASLDSYTVAASSVSTPKTLQVFAPRAGSHRFWLIWLTSVPKVTEPNGAVGYVGQLTEMKFYG